MELRFDQTKSNSKPVTEAEKQVCETFSKQNHQYYNALCKCFYLNLLRSDHFEKSVESYIASNRRHSKGHSHSRRSDAKTIS